MDHSKHTAMVMDMGLFPELAVVLARSFGRVLYHTRWKSAEPKENARLIGKGLEGVERVNSFLKVKDEVDLWVFPDIYDGDLQWDLQNEGRRVWGSRNGDELEIHRGPAKQVMAKRGIGIGDYATVIGTRALREHLKGHPNSHVKTSVTRGDMESFHVKDLQSVETRIAELESPHNLGPKAASKEFIIESTIDPAVEIGYDGYSVDGKFPTSAMCGIEAKSRAYLGHFLPANRMPRQLIEMNRKIAPVLANYQYRNFFCIEARITKDGTPWAIDPCCRAGSPPFELGMEMYTNLADILWEGAEGRCIDPIPAAEWGAEIVIHSSWADKNWQPIRFPKGMRRWVKIKNATKLDGVYYAVPQLDERGTIAAVVGFGKSAQEAIDTVKERAKHVEGYGLDIPADALDKCLSEMETAKSYGVTL